MDNIGGLNYKVATDTSSFQQGMTLTRSEFRTTRTEVRKSETDYEKLERKLNTLDKAYKAGAIELDEYHRTVVRLNAETPEAKQQADELAKAQQQAANVTKKYATDQEKLAEEIRNLKALKPHLDANTYARAIADLNKRLPENVAAEQKREQTLRRVERQQDLLARETKRGADLTRSLETATERYERELHDLDRMLRRGVISRQTYDRAVQRSSQSIDNHRRSLLSELPVIGRMQGLVGGMPPHYAAATLAIAGTAAGMYALGRAANYVIDRVDEQMQTIDQSAKVASRLGTSLEAISGIQLGASETGGLGSDTVNQALQRLVRRTSEAAKGLGEAKGVFDDLNLNAERLARQDPAVIFRTVADAISQVDDSGEQIRMTFKLFDTEGVGMINLLREGGDAVDRFQSNAKELNFALSATDAARVEQANDALGEMGLAWKGIYSSIAVEVSPILTVVADKITDIVGTITLASELSRGWSQDLARGVGNFVSPGLGDEFERRIIERREAAEAAARERERNLDQTRRDNAALADAESERANSEASANDLAMDLTAEQDRAKRLQSMIAMTDSERKEYEAQSKLRAEMQRAKAAESNAIKDGATETEARSLRIAIEKNAQLEEQLRTEKELAAQRAQANDEAERSRERQEAKAERERAAAEKAIRDQIDREREQTKQAANRIIEANRTPYDRLVERLRDAEQLLGVGALNADQAERERQAARQAFRRERDQGDRRPAAITRGSREAYDEITRVRSEAQRKEETRKKEEQALQEAQLDRLDRMVQAVENLQIVNGA